jgi:uncharacterized protein with HEPN domain
VRRTDEELRADLTDFAATARRIVDRGEDAFLAQDDVILRRAARSVIIDVATAVAALSDEAREAIPDAAAIIGMRNRVAHSYRTVNERLVWNFLQHDLPELIHRLGD